MKEWIELVTAIVTRHDRMIIFLFAWNGALTVALIVEICTRYKQRKL